MAYSVRQNPADPSNYTVTSGRSINKIVIHHAATTSFDGIGATFKNPARNASAHYGVGQYGNVDQYVQDKDMAWHAGTKDPATNPNPTSIGIENVNKTGAPSYEVADSTFDALVELVRDLAEKHKLLPLVVGKNLFGHKDFKATACPGHLYNRLAELAERVNGEDIVVRPPQPAQPDQILHVGEKFKFTQTYRVDALKRIGGIWQVKTNALCPVDFTWNDNGIPVMPLVEVAGGVGNSKDQVLQTGSKYKIPGTYTVLDLGAYKGRWMAKVDMQGWKLWVDIATVTEV